MEVISKTKTTMKRKDYERPATRVVELRQTARLLTVSDTQSSINVVFEEEDI